MEIFWLIAISYTLCSIGCGFLFSKSNYSVAMEIRKDSYSRTTLEKKRKMLNEAIWIGICQSIVWPIFLFIGIVSGLILREETQEAKAQISRQETNRILKEFNEQESWKSKYTKAIAESNGMTVLQYEKHLIGEQKRIDAKRYGKDSWMYTDKYGYK